MLALDAIEHMKQLKVVKDRCWMGTSSLSSCACRAAAGSQGEVREGASREFG